jgi:hypothetical protein
MMDFQIAVHQHETFRIDTPLPLELEIRYGEVWVTQCNDPKDHILREGGRLSLNGEGPAIVTAYKPTLLELYGTDPIGVRQALERAARAERSADVNAACGRLFAGLKTRLARLAAGWLGVSFAHVAHRR